ncbi:acyl-CoA carboxylase epsilon subunit [Streptomyces sp. JNUCC 64]
MRPTPDPTPPPGAPPQLSVVRGAPTPDELAALAVVVLSRGTTPPPTEEPPATPGWRGTGPYQPAGSWRVLPG